MNNKNSWVWLQKILLALPALIHQTWLKAHYVPGAVLGTGDIQLSVNAIDKTPFPRVAYTLVEESEQTHK